MFNNLRETCKLFEEENDKVYISQSLFAKLRPAFVIPKAASTQRICLCLYHENICLTLKVLDKYVTSKCSSPSLTFTYSLVCSTTNEEYMFSSCSFCKNLFTEKAEETYGRQN